MTSEKIIIFSLSFLLTFLILAFFCEKKDFKYYKTNCITDLTLEEYQKYNSDIKEFCDKKLKDKFTNEKLEGK